MKTVTITSKDISTKQWSNLLLELNLIRKAWKPYATLNLEARGLKNVIKWVLLLTSSQMINRLPRYKRNSRVIFFLSDKKYMAVEAVEGSKSIRSVGNVE